MKLWHFIGAGIATLVTAPIAIIALSYTTFLWTVLVIYPPSLWMLKMIDDWHLK